jgi:hypothetical protein
MTVKYESHFNDKKQTNKQTNNAKAHIAYMQDAYFSPVTLA